MGELIAVPPGIVLYERVRDQLRLDSSFVRALEEGQSLAVDVEIEYSHASGRYELRDLRLRSEGELAPEITGALLRTIRVQSVLQHVALGSLSVLDHLSVWDPDGEVAAEFSDSIDFLRGDVANPLRSGLKPPDEHMLAHVAIVYRAAEISSQNPGEQVAERFGMQRRTAANWIARSRRAGYFDRIIEGEEARVISRAWASSIAAASKQVPSGDG